MASEPSLVELDGPEYAIRWFEPGDEEGFLDLHETVFGSRYSTEWFDWRYDTPYLDDVPVVVAVFGEEIVGALTWVPFYVRGGAETALAVQPTAAMVHPDHRRQGLFSRMIDHSLDRYAHREPGVIFNFPSPSAKHAMQKLGWREVGRIPVWYRNQPPILREDDVPSVTATFKRTRVAFAELAFRARDRLSAVRSDVEVERHESVPAAVLESLYYRTVPDELHVHRDEQYYRWRYANPEWTCRTYVARRDGSPVGAVVTAKRANYPTKAILMDSLPLSDADRDPHVFDRLLAAVIRDHRSTPILRAAATIAPTRVLWQYGFVRDDLPVVSRMAHPKEMIARPPAADDESAWRLGGLRVDRIQNWLVALGDTDAP